MKHEKPVPRHEVRGNQAMISKVYEFADRARCLQTDPPLTEQQERDRRIAAQLKRERKNAKRAQQVRP